VAAIGAQIRSRRADALGEKPPTQLDALVFRLKVNLLRARRFTQELGRAPRRLPPGEAAAFPSVAAETRSPLWSDLRPSERVMQTGKVLNLITAARVLDQTKLDAGAVFSFWRQLGPATTRRGFTTGRMLQGGCLVPAVGGGLCQLSGALYETALDAGCRIIERHGHSRPVPGSRTREGRDATVAWNYVDLRFAAPRPMLLRVIVERQELVVQLLAKEAVRLRAADRRPPIDVSVYEALSALPGEHAANDCGSCGRTTCFRHERRATAPKEQGPVGL
jgi:hypothetical protein